MIIDFVLLGICVAAILFRGKVLSKPSFVGWVALGALWTVRIIEHLTHTRFLLVVLVTETILFVVGIGGLIWGQRQDTEGVSASWWLYGGVAAGLLGAIAAASLVLVK